LYLLNFKKENKMSFNSPQIDGKRTRYSHQDLHLDVRGTHVHIQVNGKVILSKVSGEKDKETGEMLMDEIEVPASLIFDVAKMLHMTRKTEIVDTHDTRTSSKE